MADFENSQQNKERDTHPTNPSAITVADFRAKTVLVTGGAGFIGSCLAARLLKSGLRVRVLDNLSSPGSEENLLWLRNQYAERLDLIAGDIRARAVVDSAVHGVGHVYHLASSSSLSSAEPFQDADINLGGTLNLLEVCRGQETPPSLVFTSAKSVYGALEDVVLSRRSRRYEPAASEIARNGINENRGLEFRQASACSKGAADQYVLEYARRFGLRAAVLRLGVIYGPRQQASPGKGWVTSFLTRALSGQPLDIHGDGLQVRDLLYIDDIVDALIGAHTHIRLLAGKAFNVGGGLENSMSLSELLDTIGVLTGVFPEVHYGEATAAEPRYYVSDNRRFQQATGWTPRVAVEEGLELLCEWLKEHRLGYGPTERRDRAMLQS